MLPILRINPNPSANKQPDHAFVFLHGLGASPEDIEPVVKTIDLQIGNGVEYILPRAPKRPLTVFNGMAVPAWYDIYAWTEGSGEDAEGLDAAAEQLEELITMLAANGYARRRIIIGGFSQGGACALHYAGRGPEPVGGVVALSAYMPLGRQWKPQAGNSVKQTPVFIAHGSQDRVLPVTYGEFAYRLLSKAGAPVVWRTYENLGHSIDEPVIHDLSEWLSEQFAWQPAAEGAASG